jgi:CRP/FNR family cyclic AMP-dependent transcriptional regulator
MSAETFDLSLLRQLPLFAPLADEALESLRPALHTVELDTGEVVVQEGDAADRLYCLVSGEVQVVKGWLEPGSRTVDVLQPYAFFGEMALVLDDTPRSATVLTTEPCRFLTLDKEAFRRFILTNADAAWELLVESFRRLRQSNTLLTEGE